MCKKKVLLSPTEAELAAKAAESESLEADAFKAASGMLDSRLRQAVYARSTHRVGEMRTLQQAFEKFDTDQSGTLSLVKFQRACEDTGFGLVAPAMYPHRGSNPGLAVLVL